MVVIWSNQYFDGINAFDIELYTDISNSLKGWFKLAFVRVFV